MKNGPSLSVCMIVKDEEENLPTLLASVESLADEMIVVDTGSKDATVAIAARFGAKVYHFPWCDDFSAARNESLRHATKDFILWLDADDELKEEEHGKIREHLRRHPGAGAFLRTYVEGEGGALQLRIFPNRRGIRFEGRIHEQVICSMESKGIPTYTCDAAILHHGYEKAGALAEKLTRNRRILEEELARRPADPDTMFFLSRTCSALGEMEAALGYLDGVIDRGRQDASARAQASFPLALFDKASILSLLGRVEEALSVLAYGKSLFPGFVLFRFLLGKLRFERKEYKEAFAELLPLKDETFERETTPINIARTTESVRRSLGVSALFVDDIEVAQECFMRTLECDPSDRAAYHHLALARERKGDVEGAVGACRQGLEVSGEDGYLRKRLFLLLLKKEDFPQALRCYETLNGRGMDVDALSGRFLLSCRALDAAGIQVYYRLLQQELSIDPLDFPQNIQLTKTRLRESGELRSIEPFESAVAFLLTQAS